MHNLENLPEKFEAMAEYFDPADAVILRAAASDLRSGVANAKAELIALQERINDTRATTHKMIDQYLRTL